MKKKIQTLRGWKDGSLDNKIFRWSIVSDNSSTLESSLNDLFLVKWLLNYYFMFFLGFIFLSWPIQSSLPKGKFSSSFHIPIFHGGSIRGFDLTLRSAKFPHYMPEGLQRWVGSGVSWFKGLFTLAIFKIMMISPGIH